MSVSVAEVKRQSGPREGGDWSQSRNWRRLVAKTLRIWPLPSQEGPEAGTSDGESWRQWRRVVWRLLGGDIEELPGPDHESQGRPVAASQPICSARCKTSRRRPRS